MAVKPNAERSSRRTALVIASLFVLFVAALFLRAYWNLDAAVQDGEFVLSAGSDPYYHKRAIDFIQENGFKTLINDPMLNYPYGSVNPNPPLYEWSVAVVGHMLAPFFDATDTMSSEQVATWWAFLWSPAIYGALTLFPVYHIGKSLFNRKAGLLAALFWVISTTSIDTSGLGSADHDSSVMFFASLAFLFYIKAIEQFRGDGHWVASWKDSAARSKGLGLFFRERKLGLMYSLLAGIGVGAVALIWKGFPYVIGIMFAYAGIQMILDHWRSRDSTGVFLGTLLTMLVGTLMAVPYYSAANVANFLQPVWFLIGAFFVAGLVLVPTRDLPTILVMPAAIIAAILGIIVAFFVIPEVANSLLYATVYFKRTALYETIAEAHPADFSTIVFSVGPVPYFAALAGFVLTIMSIKKTPARASLFAVVWFAVAIYMAMNAVRFVFNALPIISAFAGFGMARLLDWLNFSAVRKSVAANEGDFWHGVRKGTNGWHIAGAIFILLLLVVPNTLLAADAALPPAKENQIATDTDSAFVRDFVQQRLGAYGQGFIPPYWQDGLTWLAQHDANTTNPADRPGFLAWWDYGHWAIYVGQHPAVADNFQNGYEYAANFLLAQNETAATQLMAARLFGLPQLTDAKVEEILTNNGVANAADAREKMARFEFVNGMDLATSVAVLTEMEDLTGKKIRYFTTDVRMLPYDNPQTQGFIEQSSIFYAPVRLKGENPDDYVARQVLVNGRYVSGDEYKVLASDPIRGQANFAQGERYQFQPQFFNTMYWRGYVGTPPQQGGPQTGEVVLQALNQPAPARGLTHWRLVYENDGLKTLEYFRGATVTGTVNEEGTPLANVTLTAYDDAGSIIVKGFSEQARAQLTADMFNVPHGRTTTDANGQFTLTAPFAMPGGVVTIVATKTDGTEVGRSTLAITREEANSGATFTTDIVVKKGNVEGVVYNDVDGDGRYDATNDTLVDNATVSIGSVTTTTGADGKYRLESISSGVQTVNVTAGNLTVHEADQQVRVRPDNTTTHNVRVVPKPTTISGIAYADANDDSVNDEGEAAAFTTLTFAPDASVADNTAAEATAFTQSNGAYSVKLQPGTYNVTGETALNGETYTLVATLVVVDGTDQTVDFRYTRS